MSTNETLADRIREEAAQAARPGQHDRLLAIAEEVERLRRGAKTLGHIVEQQGRMVLDATGLHHMIGEDGDGDWGAVWENLYDLGGCAWDEGYRAGFSNAMRRMSDEPNAPTSTNPYRAAHPDRAARDQHDAEEGEQA
jgi:hypothetical protein